jgi:Autographiviridae endonuclease VII
MANAKNQKRYRDSNPDRVKRWKHDSYLRRKDRVRAYAIRRKFGIEPEQYDAMLAAQGGHCAICPATEPGGRDRFFHIDHDHKTGKVRGLLCRNHNLMLGYASDDPSILKAGIDYLAKAGT